MFASLDACVLSVAARQSQTKAPCKTRDLKNLAKIREM